MFQVFLFVLMSIVVHSGHGDTVNIFVVYEPDTEYALSDVMAVQKYGKVEKGAEFQVELIHQHKMDPSMDPVMLVTSLCDALEAAVKSDNIPHVVLDMTESGMTSRIVKCMTRSLGIPTVSMSYTLGPKQQVWNNLTADEEKYLIHYLPQGDIITNIIRAISINQGLSNVAIIHDDAFILEGQQETLLAGVTYRTIIIQIVDEEGSESIITKGLEDIKKYSVPNIFVVGTSGSIVSVMKAAQEGKYLKSSHWYFVAKDNEIPSCGECEKIPVIYAGPSNPNSNKYKKLVNKYGLRDDKQLDHSFYFDVTLTTVMAVNNMLKSGSWPNDYKPLTCESEEVFDTNRLKPVFKLREEMFKIELPYTLPFGKLKKNDSNPLWMEFQMKLQTLNDKSKDGANSISEYGIWKTGYPTGNLVARKSYTPSHLIVSVVEDPPFINFLPNDKYSGYCIDLWKDIMKLLPGVTYIFVPVPDGYHGLYNDTTQKWNGMIKELTEKRVDVALGSLSITAARAHVIDFTLPIYESVGVSSLMHKRKVKTDFFKYANVLELDVWGAITVAYFCTGIFMWILDIWSPYSYQNNKEYFKNDEEQRIFTLRESLWFGIMSLTPQGGGEAPKNFSGQLISATWWLFAFIIMASYTANLAAFLTVSKLEKQILTMEDLILQYKIQYSVTDNSLTKATFERLSDVENSFYEKWKEMSLNDTIDPYDHSRLAVWDYPLRDKYTKIWIEMNAAGYPPNRTTAVTRILTEDPNSGFAWIGETPELLYTARTICSIVVLDGDPLFPKPYAIAVQKDSPLQGTLSDAINNLTMGTAYFHNLDFKWFDKSNLPRLSCPRDLSNIDGIPLEDIGGVFVTLTTGLILGIFIVPFEFCRYKYSRGGINYKEFIKSQYESTEIGVKKFGKDSHKMNENDLLKVARNNVNLEGRNIS